MQLDDTWSAPSPQDSSPKVEYESLAELWLFNRPGMPGPTRKLQTAQQRKRNNDKREAVSQLSALTDGSPKRLKEKTSWLGMSRGYGAAASSDGQWIRVRCVLSEQHEQDCRLVILGDKEMLQHSLNIRLLNATDIRFSDRSLVYRNNCISINAPQHAFHAYSPSLQAVMSREYTAQRSREGLSLLDPIFLAFESKDVAHAWCAVLRSFSIPEIYGHDKHGLYRVWRQVNLSILNARNIGVVKKSSNSNLDENGAVSVPEEISEANPDLYINCEVVMDGVIIARTTPQKGQVANNHDPSSLWTWHESFVLADLPPFRPLIVRVWRFKKGSRPVLLGHVEMLLAHIRKGQFQEGWFPVLNAVNSESFQVGDLRMKLKVDEECILPAEAYASITSTLDSHNCLDLLCELDQRLRMTDMSIHMLSLAVGRSTFVKDIMELAEREVDNAPNPNTLFRGNSVFTKTVEHAMTFFGRSFLEASVGPSIHDLVTENVELETDPTRNLKGPKDAEMNAKILSQWCQKFWHAIYSMKEHCPQELRMLFKSIRELVERRFKDNEDATNLKWQSVSAFCFLRLIVPAILHPHLWGLCPGLPSPGLQRSLTLIAKNLQSLANLAKEKKENQVQGVASFLDSNRHLMIEYINVISNPFPDRAQPAFQDRSDRARILRELDIRRDKIRASQPLHSESIPVLPHLLDIPKHLAILTTAVTRHARANPQTLNSRPLGIAQESLVEDFAMKCFEIEEKVTDAINQVDAHRLATTTVASRSQRPVVSRNSSSPGSPGGHNNDPSENSSSGPQVTEIIIRHPRESHRTRRSSVKRPSTAPARSSSTDSASMPLPTSPPLRLLRGKASDDSGVSSPPMSPLTRGFGHQPSASASLSLSATDQSIMSQSALVTSDTEPIPDTLSSSQFDIDALDPAKPRKGFLRGFLGRNTKS